MNKNNIIFSIEFVAKLCYMVFSPVIAITLIFKVLINNIFSNILYWFYLICIIIYFIYYMVISINTYKEIETSKLQIEIKGSND